MKACGICGSDLHFAKHGADDARPRPGDGRHARRWATHAMLDLDQDVYMGHEFCAEVLEVGPDTVGPAPGTLVTSIPVLLTMSGVKPIVYSNDVAAGYGERMLLSAPMLARGAQRARLPARRPHRADGRRPARREQEPHQARRGRPRARLRPGGPGGDRRAEAQGHRHDRRHRLLTSPTGARHHDGRHRGGRPRPRSRPSTPGCAPAAASRSCASRRSACPGSSTPCSATLPTARGSWSSGSAWRPTASTRSSGSARS